MNAFDFFNDWFTNKTDTLLSFLKSSGFRARLIYLKDFLSYCYFPVVLFLPFYVLLPPKLSAGRLPITSNCHYVHSDLSSTLLQPRPHPGERSLHRHNLIAAVTRKSTACLRNSE